MLSVAQHPHYIQQHYVQDMLPPQSAIPLPALSHVQLPIPRLVQSSSRPHSVSSPDSSPCSSQSSVYSSDTYSALALLSMSGPQLCVTDGTAATMYAQSQEHQHQHQHHHHHHQHQQQQQQQQQQHHHRQYQQHQHQHPMKQEVGGSVAQALEIARESPDGASDPTISRILETAISAIWGRVMARPDDYVMTRDEFSVFNFFQHRFEGNDVAVGARRRYWNSFTA